MSDEGDVRSDRRHRPGRKEDNRNPFERDRDRIIYTSAYRRLGGVTQVVSALEGHVFHNRLTHTIKVAQVAQRLAEMLLRQVDDARRNDSNLPPAPLDAAATEAAAHAHDIGHPPFGHVAEEELQRLMRESCGNDGFEGNAQSFRTVTQVANAHVNYPGLNLTRATLNGILKYPWKQNAAPQEPLRKWGAYASEDDDFRFARDARGGDSPQEVAQSLEAAVMDWADDITYAVHDFEDLYRAGLIPADRFRADKSQLDSFGEWVAARWRAAQAKDEAVDDEEIRTSLRNIWALFAIDEPYTGSADQRVSLRTFTSALIKRYVPETRLEFTDGRWRLVIKPAHALEVGVLKQLTWRYVIERPALAAQQHGQKAIIAQIYRTFADAADPDVRSTPASLLPIRTAEQLDSLRKAHSSTPYSRARLVCDAICSITEDEAVRLHSRLTGQSLGSVLDAIV